MRKFLSILSLLSVLMGGAILSSCKKEKEIVHVGQVALDQTSLEMVEGTTAKLVATVLPAEAEDKTLEWSSTDAEVATVDADGLVSALKPGTAVIKATAKDGGIAASCEVSVTKRIIAVTGITLDKTTLPIKVGGNYTLAATIAPPDATDKSVTWASDDTDVAMVDSKGKVVGVSVGTAHITATSVSYPDIKAECEVNVSSDVVAVTGVTLDKTEATLVVGETLQLAATIAPENATDQRVRWSVSPESIASVSESGLVTAITAGNATVTATTMDGGFSATCALTVNHNEVLSIAFSQASTSPIRLEYGSKQVLTVVFNPENASNTALDWSFSPAGAARIDEGESSGNSYAVYFDQSRTGKITVTATSQQTPSVKTSQTFTIWCNPTAMTAYPASFIISTGGTANLSAIFEPTYATETGLTYASNDESIVTVDNSGKMTGVAAGETTVTMTSKAVSSLTQTCNVKVIAVNKVSINDGEAQSYQTGSLGTLLQDKTVTSLVWEAGVLDADDVASLNSQCRSTATSIDMRNVLFSPGDKTYQVYGSSSTYKIESATELPSGIFLNFNQLTSLQLPAVKSIREYAINRTGLTSLTLPEGLVNVRDYGIAMNSSLKTMNFPSTLTDASQSAFRENSVLEGTLDLSHFKYIRSQLLEGCKKVTKIILGAALESIDGTAFATMESLQTFEFTGENTYYKTTGSWITSKDGTIVYFVPMAGANGSGYVVVPEGVKEIRKAVFNYYHLTNILLPEGFESFPQMYALGHYTGQEITLPSTLKSMHYLTFGYSTTLKKVTVLAETPPTILDSTDHAFHECKALEEIFVPAGSVDAYKAADGWKAHADIIKAIPTE
ncbi:MAG: Ig-like domain-containing protein [Bacteroidales bacterium]|nr:Ig-like domain-containing protein [Bacteroidales bacterium]